MRIQLIILLSFLSLSAFAVDDKSMKELFAKYDLVMDQKKTDLIEEVFSKKFIRDSGGKQELTEKIKELTTPPSPSKTSMSWKKGQKGEVYLAKVKEISANKMKDSHESEFIVISEDGKLKIDGTMSDGN
jgi:hypothetical protein